MTCKGKGARVRGSSVRPPCAHARTEPVPRRGRRSGRAYGGFGRGHPWRTVGRHVVIAKWVEDEARQAIEARRIAANIAKLPEMLCGK
jgi:hypothetical protein